MSRLAALQNLAKSHYNPNQARDSDGRWTAIKTIAQSAVEKGIVAGAGVAGQHIAGEAGALAAMVGARAAIVVGKNIIQSTAAKQNDEELGDTLEKLAMGDVIGREVTHAVSGAIGDLTGISGLADTGVGMAASAVFTPKLVAAAQSLRGEMQPAQQILQVRMT